MVRLAADEYFSVLNLRFKERGGRDTIKFAKAVRLSYTRALAGSPLRQQENLKIRPSDGLPSRFTYLNRLFNIGTPESLRSMLTILTVTRAIRLPPKIDTDPITDAYSGSIPQQWDTLRSPILRGLLVEKRRCY